MRTGAARRSQAVGRWGRRRAELLGRAYRWVSPDSLAEGCRVGRGVFLDGLDRIRLGERVILSDSVNLSAREPGSISIGRRTFLNAGTTISSTGLGISIGEDVLFGPHTTVVDQNHSYDDPTRPIARQGMKDGGAIRIGDGAWVAAGAVVLGPTTLAPGCVVGANSVVKGDFPRRCVIAGAPARVVRFLDDQTPSGETPDD